MNGETRQTGEILKLVAQTMLDVAANLGARTSPSTGASSRRDARVPGCENGVCAVSWKPERPAAA